MAMEKNTSQTYETSDIALASYLFSSGTNLLDIDRTNPHRAIFIFDYLKPALLFQWQEGKSQVNALAIYSVFQTLKARLFGRER